MKSLVYMSNPLLIELLMVQNMEIFLYVIYLEEQHERQISLFGKISLSI